MPLNLKFNIPKIDTQMKKIILLSSVIVLVLGGLLYFVKTRLDPPVGIMPERQFLAEAQACVDNINPRASEETLCQQYFKAAHLIEFMAKNDMLKGNDADDLKRKLADKYVKAWSQKCFEKFKLPRWDDDYIKEVQKRVAFTKKLSFSDGSRVIDKGSDNNDLLDSIFAVTKSYENAWKFTENCVFSNMASSRKTMAKANAYKNHYFLRFNVELCDSLKAMGQKLDNAHYKRLEQRVENLYYLGERTEEEYNKTYDNVISDINVYADSAQIVYGYFHNTNNLKSKAESNKKHALDPGWFFEF